MNATVKAQKPMVTEAFAMNLLFLFFSFFLSVGCLCSAVSHLCFTDSTVCASNRDGPGLASALYLSSIPHYSKQVLSQLPTWVSTAPDEHHPQSCPVLRWLTAQWGHRWHLLARGVRSQCQTLWLIIPNTARDGAWGLCILYDFYLHPNMLCLKKTRPDNKSK